MFIIPFLSENETFFYYP